MNIGSSLDAIAALLPLALRPYTLWIVIGAAVVLVLICWRLISIILRIGWTIRLLLALGSLAAYAGVHGCSTTAAQNAASHFSGGGSR